MNGHQPAHYADGSHRRSSEDMYAAGMLVDASSSFRQQQPRPALHYYPAEEDEDGQGGGGGVPASEEDRKRLKRAANRRSAQLSRQRKKKYIEELASEHSKLKVWLPAYPHLHISSPPYLSSRSTASSVPRISFRPSRTWC